MTIRLTYYTGNPGTIHVNTVLGNACMDCTRASAEKLAQALGVELTIVSV